MKSQAHYARVLVQGVPAYGIIDSGADITIMGGALFRQTTTAARLKERDFWKADKTPHTYPSRYPKSNKSLKLKRKKKKKSPTF